MRQTQLTFEELVGYLKNGGGPYPRCLIVHELGQVAIAGERRAERLLAELLNAGSDRRDRYAAYCSLMQVAAPLGESRAALVTFVNDDGNQGMVNIALGNHGIDPGPYLSQPAPAP